MFEISKTVGRYAFSISTFIAFWFVINIALAAEDDDDILLMTVPNIVATLKPCDASDVTRCRNMAFCDAAGGLFFEGSCRVKCTSANVTSCLVKTTCESAGGLYFQESCRPNAGVLGQLASMEGTWRFSSSLGTDVFYFDFDDVELNSVAQYAIVGDKQNSSFDGFLVYNPNIQLFELLEFSSLGHTFDYRQYSLNTATTGSGLHGLSVESTTGFDMSVARISTLKTF